MNGAKLELYVSLEVAPLAARDAAMAILKTIGTRTPPYEHVTLTLGLRGLHLPVDADITVPIHATVDVVPLRWECHLEVEADGGGRFFPRFSGMLTITPKGRNTCELWLQGNYTVPMGLFGKNIDATMLNGAAEQSLQRFMEWLATEVK